MNAEASRKSASAGSGITLALIAFSGFPIGDALVKSMALDWPAAAVAALRFTIGAIALALILGWREGRQGFRIRRPWLHAARGGWRLATGTITFFSAIYVMPLAEAVAIAFVNPIITALAVRLVSSRKKCARRPGWRLLSPLRRADHAAAQCRRIWLGGYFAADFRLCDGRDADSQPHGVFPAVDHGRAIFICHSGLRCF